jgi:hypothetical protein
VGDSQNIEVTNKRQIKAMDIREEAVSQMELQALSYAQKATTTMSIEADVSVDIKGAIVKIN